MIYFNCDYLEGTHERILNALNESNMEQSFGYGEDAYTEKATQCIQGLCGGEPAVHFLVGGTQTNLTVISAALRPHQCVLSAQQGHINVHETGAIEAGGHKVVGLPSKDGKLTAKQVEQAVTAHRADGAFEHITQPKLVYISNPTELGTIYSKKELEDLREVCSRYDLILYMDGARLGYGLAAAHNDLDLPTISRLCDVFYIGGTKVGALFGEAVVIHHPLIRQDFRYIIKQKGGMLAKGRLLGLQFYELFRDGLYFEVSAHAIRMADILRQAFLDCGYELPIDGGTNQLFVAMPDAHLRVLQEDFTYDYTERLDESHSLVRFCTSWATRPEHVGSLVEALRELAQQ